VVVLQILKNTLYGDFLHSGSTPALTFENLFFVYRFIQTCVRPMATVTSSLSKQYFSFFYFFGGRS
jgi:hypothetical protein